MKTRCRAIEDAGRRSKKAAALLDAFVERGIAIGVTHRAKRRLYGLKHLAPLREEAAPPDAGAAARAADARGDWPDRRG
jgi:hypothetical protein